MVELQGSPGERPAIAAGPPVVANPLLDVFREAMATGADVDDTRTESIATYGFAIPSDEALDAISRWSPRGLVEVGAGAGYWAYVLRQRGIDVIAFDIEPAPSARNSWFAGTRPWHPVHRGDHDTAAGHADRTLLIAWPTKNEIWAASAVERYHEAGGECVLYVGEGPSGRTGDDVFHAVLGDLTGCVQCDYGSTASPCICDVEARWSLRETVELPHWPGYRDDLRVYTRRNPANRARSPRFGMRRPR